jgi:4-hydroxy-tetrahydrodipicolinate synthase
MGFDRLHHALEGPAITTVTPFTSDLSDIDIQGIERNISFLKQQGARFVVPCGNTGEFYSLSEAEWKKVVSATKEVAGESVAVAAGVGLSIKTAESQIDFAKSLELDGVMILYPQHVFISEEGLLHYYEQLIERADGMGVILYKKGPHLTDDVLAKLMKYPNLAAVKYAFGRIVDFAHTIHRLGTKILWSCGTAERFAPFYWLAGARGLTTGLGNFAPHISQEMYNALSKGDFEEAMRLQRLISPFEELREGRDKANNVPVVKAVMDHIGLAGGECRPPISSLTEQEQQSAIEAVADWHLQSP